jgi:hypothetical protein
MQVSVRRSAEGNASDDKRTRRWQSCGPVHCATTMRQLNGEPTGRLGPCTVEYVPLPNDPGKIEIASTPTMHTIAHVSGHRDFDNARILRSILRPKPSLNKLRP